MKHFFTFLFTILTAFVFSQEWIVRTVGTCPDDKAYSVCVGKGRNDGINRVYVSTRGEQTDGRIYEFSYNGNNWSTPMIVGANLRNLVTLCIGDARNDGISRLYAAEWGGTSSRVFEFSWNGNAWVSAQIEMTGKPMLSCMIGDVEGDGLNKLYVSGYVIHREYFWTGGAWQKTDLNTVFGSEGQAVIAQGKNDGIVHYYTPGSRIREFSWNGTQFIVSDSISAQNGWPEAVVVTPSRNDNINRVITVDNSGIWEFSWNGTLWLSNKISGRFGRGFLISGITKSDGQYYIYSSDKDSVFKEISYNPTQNNYTFSDFDAISGATALLDIGVGKNDDTVRIYIPNYSTGLVYELTNISPYVYNTSTGLLPHKKAENILVYPVVTSEILTVSNISTKYSQINIFSHDGKKLKTIYPENFNIDIDVSSMKKGMYFISIHSGKNTTVQKFIKL